MLFISDLIKQLCNNCIAQVDGYDADTKALVENSDHRVIIKVRFT